MRYEGNQFYFKDRHGSDEMVMLPATITAIEPSDDGDSCIIQTESGLFSVRNLLDNTKTTIYPLAKMGSCTNVSYGPEVMYKHDDKTFTVDGITLTYGQAKAIHSAYRSIEDGKKIWNNS